MRPQFLICLVVLAACLTSWPVWSQADWTVIAREAAFHYEQGDYESARVLYESLVEQGIRQAALYFNLGQTYWQSGDLGRALVNFRRAQALAPRDRDIQTALSQARSVRKDLQGDELAFPDYLAALTLSWLTEDESLLFVAFFWAALLCLAAFRLSSVRKPKLRLPFVVVGVLFIASLLLWVSRIYVGHYRVAAVVIEDVTTVMSGPGESYIRLYDVHAGAEMRILNLQGDWAHFVLPDLREGWIQVDAVESV
jgi:tetratricopeptide (TPR) repeat protein